MNKYNCDIIQDLLALYHDGVCSEESRLIVEEHLSQCEKCSAVEKQLSDTALETDLIGQTKGVLKTHKKKQLKKLLLVLAVISSVLIIIVGLYLFHLKRSYDKAAQQIYDILPDVDKGAEYFTEYDVSDDSFVTIETETMFIDIPSEFTEQHRLNSDPEREILVCRSEKEDAAPAVMVREYTSDLRDITLINYDDTKMSKSERQAVTDWFEELGLGLPDSAYGFYKCIYLLDNDHRSRNDLECNLAYMIAALIKNEICMGERQYIYEAEDKCGIIMVNEIEEENCYCVTVDLYKPDDLNTAYTVSVMDIESMDDAFAIINSIKLKQTPETPSLRP